MSTDHQFGARLRTNAGANRDDIANFINLNILEPVAGEALNNVFAAQFFSKRRGRNLSDFNLLVHTLIVLVDGKLQGLLNQIAFH